MPTIRTDTEGHALLHAVKAIHTMCGRTVPITTIIRDAMRFYMRHKLKVDPDIYVGALREKSEWEAITQAKLPQTLTSSTPDAITPFQEKYPDAHYSQLARAIKSIQRPPDPGPGGLDWQIYLYNCEDSEYRKWRHQIDADAGENAPEGEFYDPDAPGWWPERPPWWSVAWKDPHPALVPERRRPPEDYGLDGIPAHNYDLAAAKPKPQAGPPE